MDTGEARLSQGTGCNLPASGLKRHQDLAATMGMIPAYRSWIRERLKLPSGGPGLKPSLKAPHLALEVCHGALCNYAALAQSGEF